MDALVLGGTGPTGPYIVNGLLERGYEVTIMHGGFHEAEFAGPVEDLHGDVHFKESLQETLGNRTFDLVIFTYGRLLTTAEFMVGRTGHFIAVGSHYLGGRPGPRDPRWGPLGRPFLVTDDNRLPPDPPSSGLSNRILDALERLMELHREGRYSATYIGYPNIYGPRAPAPEDWCVVKRILDGRRQLIVADGGIKIHQQGYAENVAESILVAVDKPRESAGETFVVAEQPLYTIRQCIELICKTMNWEMELVDMPYPLAKSCHYLWHSGPAHDVCDDSKIRKVLGFKEIVPVGEARIRTVKWLVENREKYSKEWEEQIDETFDYEAEDELIRRWKETYHKLAEVEFHGKPAAHRYRHPRTAGEAWRRPEHTRRFGERPLEYY